MRFAHVVRVFIEKVEGKPMQQPPEYPQYPQQPQQPYPPQTQYGAPPPPPPGMMPPGPPPKKKFRLPVWAWIIIAIFVLGAIGSMFNRTPGTTTPGTTSAAPTDTPTPAATPTPSPTPKPKVWTTVQTFTGNGNKKTTTFTAPDDWKIIWKCDPTNNAIGQYNVIVDVKAADGSDVDPGAINTICKSGNTTGETEERQGGQVYLDVSSEDNWTVQIQVQK